MLLRTLPNTLLILLTPLILCMDTGSEDVERQLRSQEKYLKATLTETKIPRDIPSPDVKYDLPWFKQGLLEETDPAIFEKKHLKSTIEKGGTAGVVCSNIR